MILNPNIIACPICKTELSPKDAILTPSDRLAHANLYCGNCKKSVGVVDKLKYIFKLTSEVRTENKAVQRLPSETLRRRIPWNSSLIKSNGFKPIDVPWNAEPVPKALYSAGEKGSKISFVAESYSTSARFISHNWSGKVKIFINGEEFREVDLFHKEKNEVVVIPIYSKTKDSSKQLIEITASGKNPASNAAQIFFLGFDVLVPASSKIDNEPICRGNGYPQTYDWMLGKLPGNSLVLDFGCGDRRHADPRVIGFEYLDFEGPDVVGDGHQLPFKDAVFDAIGIQAVFEHVSNPFVVAKEIFRTLKPGGLIYAETAFMQPLHAVPYHYFNTTTWGMEEVFCTAGTLSLASEWFGPLSSTLAWMIDSCNSSGAITADEKANVVSLLQKIDRKISYENLKSVAGSVAYWGMKPGGSEMWRKLVESPERPTFKYSI